MNSKKTFFASSTLFASVAFLALNAPNILVQAADVHTVSHGEYLYVIAQKYGVTVENIREWNNLTSDDLYTGDQLIVTPVEAVSETTSQVTSNTEVKDTIVSQTSTSSSNESYTVKAGDTLYSIASRHGLSVEELKQKNNLNSNSIYVGNILNLKGSTASSGENTSTPTQPDTPIQAETTPETGLGDKISNESAAYYIVKRGDSLWSIANAHGITVENLQDWNNLSSNYIYTGDRLAVVKPNSTGSSAETPWVPSQPESPTDPGSGDSADKKPTAYYTVQRGDSLWSIATAHGITVKNLQDWNNLSSNYIYTGNRLAVAKPSSTESPTGNPSAPSQPENPANPGSENSVDNKPTAYYTVQRGDSLWSIANAHGITVKNLQDWNNLSSNYIYTGNRLAVVKPSSTESPAETPSAPSQPEAPTNPGSGDSSVSTPTAYYTVQRGDSLWSIANAHGITVKNLQDWNNLSSNYIYTGNRLAVMKPSTVGSVNNSDDSVPVTSYSVFIDAGHGGWETGAVTGNVYEKDLNLNISKQVADQLRAQGYTVFETRRNDSYVQLHERDDRPNELETDIFVSIHHNAMPQSARGTASGIVTLYHDRSIDEPDYLTPDHHTDQMLSDGRRLAQALQTGMVDATGGKNQGIRPQNLHVTRTTDMPAALVELGFMDHPAEFKKLTNSTYQAKLIDGLVNGINRYFGR